jgi:hypothetical protein
MARSCIILPYRVVSFRLPLLTTYYLQKYYSSLPTSNYHSPLTSPLDRYQLLDTALTIPPAPFDDVCNPSSLGNKGGVRPLLTAYYFQNRLRPSTANLILRSQSPQPPLTMFAIQADWGIKEESAHSHHLLLTTHHSLRTTYKILPTSNCLLPTATHRNPNFARTLFKTSMASDCALFSPSARRFSTSSGLFMKKLKVSRSFEYLVRISSINSFLAWP